MIIYMKETIEFMASEIKTKEEQEELLLLISSGVRAETESGIEYLKITE